MAVKRTFRQICQSVILNFKGDATSLPRMPSHLQRAVVRRKPAFLGQRHHLPDLHHGEGDGDPGGTGEHPRRLGHVLLVLLVLGLPQGRHGELLVEGGGAADGGGGDYRRGGALALHQVDGGDGDGAGRDGDVFGQDLVFWRRGKKRKIMFTYIGCCLKEG